MKTGIFYNDYEFDLQAEDKYSVFMHLNNTISKYIGQKTSRRNRKMYNPIRRLSVTENMPQQADKQFM